MRFASARLCCAFFLITACGDDGGTDSGPGADAARQDGGPADGGGNGSPTDGGGDGAPSDAAPATEVTLDVFDVAGQANLPLVAAKDGDGAWQAVTGTAGHYSFEATSGRYGLYYVCTEGDTGFTRSTVLYALRAELPSLTVYCALSMPTATVTGMAGPLVTGDDVQIALGRSFTGTSTLTGSSFSVMAYAVPTDIVAVRNRTGELSSLILERSIALASGAHDFDFAADGMQVIEQALTVAGASPADTVFATSSIATAGGTRAGLRASATAWSAVPMARLAPGDVHQVRVSAVDTAAETERWVSRYVDAPADLMVMLPPLLPMPSIAAEATAPYVRVSATVARMGAAFYSLSFYPSAGTRRFWLVYASDGYLEAAGSDVLETPALAMLPGWDAEWGFTAADGELRWYVQAMVTNRTIDDLFHSFGAAGSPYRPGTTGLIVRGSQRTGMVP